jgi:hypothetical protein
VLRWVTDNIRLYEGITRTAHFITNLVVSVDEGGRSAIARSYVVVFQEVLPDFALQAIYSGRYEDSFRKVDGEWHFAQRLIFTLGQGDASAHLQSGDP